MLWPPKNSYKEFDNEKKNPAARKFPSPHNFSNGPSLKASVFSVVTKRCSLGRSVA